MSTVHPGASISPTKLEIVRDWLVATDWFSGDPASLKSGGRFGYRFDDPAGEVGIEVVIATDGEQVYQVPLSYRSAERTGDGFLTHMEHSVLGRRWIYDGLTDPVMVTALVTAITTGGTQEDFEAEVDGRTEVFPSVVQARGTGSDTTAPTVDLVGLERNGAVSVVSTSAGDLVVPHVVGTMGLDGRDGLVGTWPDGPGDAVFAVLGTGRV